MQDQFKETIEKILKKLDDIEVKINRIPVVQPVYPTYLGSPNTCSKCGMRWEGVMSYYCSNPGCPVQMQVTSQISTSTGDFNIESPDPDKRTWYYDGDGTKRKKHE
jgi:hypothetical protein